MENAFDLLSFHVLVLGQIFSISRKGNAFRGQKLWVTVACFLFTKQNHRDLHDRGLGTPAPLTSSLSLAGVQASPGVNGARFGEGDLFFLPLFWGPPFFCLCIFNYSWESNSSLSTIMD